MIEPIAINDFAYDLPDDRIAKFPVEPRDSSKLLTYKKGIISETIFRDLSNQLPQNAFLVFNNTKVIPARLHFQKATGAIIEVFLLHPILPSTVISQVMEATETCTWQCIIGNKKRWKNEILEATFEVDNQQVVLTAELVDADANEVRFAWKTLTPPLPPPQQWGGEIAPSPLLGRVGVGSGAGSFATLVKAFGEMPLPPYMNRKAEEKDLETYQTVYSKHDGAVAAPTAGLHFTESVLSDLEKKGFKADFVTLHVGAGTFQPVKTEDALEHPMHEEQVVFSLAFIENLLVNIDCVIPIGTTSMRSLESLYWFGVKLLNRENEARKIPFYIEQMYPYGHQKAALPETFLALQEVINYMKVNGLSQLIGETQIYIFPGYKMKICKGIITNFHQPKSTLLLLISALVGNSWRDIYDYALKNDFRFLSYGDSSLLMAENS